MKKWQLFLFRKLSERGKKKTGELNKVVLQSRIVLRSSYPMNILPSQHNLNVLALSFLSLSHLNTYLMQENVTGQLYLSQGYMCFSSDVPDSCMLIIPFREASGR